MSLLRYAFIPVRSHSRRPACCIQKSSTIRSYLWLCPGLTLCSSTLTRTSYITSFSWPRKQSFALSRSVRLRYRVSSELQLVSGPFLGSCPMSSEVSDLYIPDPGFRADKMQILVIHLEMLPLRRSYSLSMPSLFSCVPQPMMKESSNTTCVSSPRTLSTII